MMSPEESQNCTQSCILAIRGRMGSAPEIEGKTNMLWTIFAVLLVLWLLGFSLHIAGGLIHLLLVVALVVSSVINLRSGLPRLGKTHMPA